MGLQPLEEVMYDEALVDDLGIENEYAEVDDFDRQDMFASAVKNIVETVVEEKREVEYI